MATMGIIAWEITGTPGTRDVHEKAGSYRRFRAIFMAEAKNQVIEKKEVNSEVPRPGRVKKNRCQNEGITRHIYEKK
ncbi:MAG: hypothetical protein WAO35_15980 [Terriglobia bacterium]